MNKNKIYLDIADKISEFSKCASLQVGCVIEKDGRIISIGYNGTPSGYVNCNEVFNGPSDEHSIWSDKYEIHAELNAILFAAKNGVSIDGATLYCSVRPCWQCTKNIIQSGIKKIIYRREYHRISKSEQDMLKQFVEFNKIEYIKEN